MKRTLLLAAMACTCLCGMAPAQPGQPPAAEAALGRPPMLQNVGLDQRLDEQVPLDLPFRDEDGRSVTLSEYFTGRPVILVLAQYRCPMLCTQVLNGLVDALRNVTFQAGTEFQVVTVSFDTRETPELAAAKKASYLGRYGRPRSAGGWHFLTGEQVSIDRLTQAVGFRYSYDAATDRFAHASGVLVLTPAGRVSRYFYGIRYSPRDLRLGLVEAADNQIGSHVDQVLLFCFHYDAATGKYSASAMAAVRAGGVLTLLALGTFMLFGRWRDRRRLAAAATTG